VIWNPPPSPFGQYVVCRKRGKNQIFLFKIRIISAILIYFIRFFSFLFEQVCNFFVEICAGFSLGSEEYMGNNLHHLLKRYLSFVLPLSRTFDNSKIRGVNFSMARVVFLYFYYLISRPIRGSTVKL
jgi:hypothetical protein